MSRIIKLSESDLINIIDKVISEQTKENINPNNLKFGDGGKMHPDQVDDVKSLQQKLMNLGFLKTKSMKPTGFFGNLTRAALNSYNGVSSQKIADKKIEQPKIVDKKIPQIKPVNGSKSTIPQNTNQEPKVYLYFDGRKLQWIVDGKVVKTWEAVSGRTKLNTFGDKNAEAMVKKYGDNYKEFMKEKEQGPIPSGNYTVSQVQERTNGNATQFIQGKSYKQLFDLMMAGSKHDWNSGVAPDLIAWGDFRLPITKKGDTETYGRGSFYIHGGGIPGSIGCIDLTTGMNDFAKYFLDWKSKNPNKKMNLVVRY
jgi:hypothetical protein